MVTLDRPRSPLNGLADVLPRRRRRRFTEALLLDVVDAVRESRLLHETVFANPEPATAPRGRRHGLPEGVEGDEASSVKEAIQVCLEGGAQALALLRGDLALLEAQDLAFLLGRVAEAPRWVLVPTPRSPGLSIVLTRPAEAPSADFREGDLPSWQAEARRRGLAPEVYGMPAGMRPARTQDLLQVYNAAHQSRAKGLLKEWGMGPILRKLEGERP